MGSSWTASERMSGDMMRGRTRGIASEGLQHSMHEPDSLGVAGIVDIRGHARHSSKSIERR
jgi:hypothetical protein